MNREGNGYYGALFWISLVSFSVPIVVAVAAFRSVPLTTHPTPHPDASGVDHQLWDYLLKTYVAGGLVDYDGIRRDHVFRIYLRQLGDADPSKLTTAADQLALLCNAYNAFVINGVITHGITDSVMNFKQNGTGFFDLEEHIFAGKTVSLNFIEHELVRKRFHEPRIHFALVCAAKSCPGLRPEAYTGPRLAQQLEDQSLRFANDPRYVALDSDNHQLILSALLDWYGDDWQSQGGILPWLASRVRAPELAHALQEGADGSIPIVYAHYDWSLNTQDRNGETVSDAAVATHAEFGSGTVPNR